MRIEYIAMYVDDLERARLELMNRPDMEDSQKPLLRTGYIHLAFSAAY